MEIYHLIKYIIPIWDENVKYKICIIYDLPDKIKNNFILQN